MTTKNFVVKNGLTTGNIILDAGSSNVSANFVVANLSVPAFANLGSVSNVTITGGSDGYVLSTDGAGILSWVAQTGGGGSGSPGGSNTYVQFNDAGSFGGNSSFTFNKTTGTLSSTIFSGAGNLLSNIQGANVTGTVANATYADSASFADTAGYASTADTAGTVTSSAQPNITSVGTLSSLGVTANITAGNVTGANLISANFISANGSLLTDINGSNVTGTVANATYALSANSATYLNGHLSGILYVDDHLIVGGPYDRNQLALTTGDGAQLLSLQEGNVYIKTGSAGTVEQSWNFRNDGYLTLPGNTFAVKYANGTTVDLNGPVANANYANYAGTAYSIAGSNVSGDVSGANHANIADVANSVSGSNVSGQVSNSLVAGTVYTAAQPNITSVGSLTGLSVSGDATITGNLTVSGSFEYANVTSFKVKDPIIEQGGNPNGTPLSSNDGFDRGQILHYYSGTAIDAFMGWDNSNAEFAFGSNVSVASEVVTFNSLGNVRAGYFLGNGSQLTGTIANANYSAYAGNVTISAQSNITSLGTLTGLTSNGVVNFTNTSNVTLGAVGNLHVSGGSNGYILQTDGSGNLEWVENLPSTTVFSANSIALTGGVYVSGNIASIQTFGDYLEPNGVYVLTDGSGSAPAWYLDIDFLAVTDFNRVVLNINYTQSSGHTIYVELYNNTTSVWDSVGTYTGLGSYYAFALQVISSTPYIDSGRVQLRLYHSNSGNVSHTTSVDYAALELSSQGPQGPRGPTGATGSTGPGVATGGTSGQVLIKNSSTNYDTAWSSSLSLTGNISSGNANLGNLVTANYLSGDGSLLTSLTAANITGQVANSLIAGTVYTNAQPNITSTGTLTSLTVSGLVTATGTGVKTANILDSTGVTTITTRYSSQSGDVGITGNLTVGTGGTGNVTINGTLNVTGTITDTAGDLTLTSSSNGNVVIVADGTGRITLDGMKWPAADGTANYTLTTDGAGNLSWAALASGGANIVTDNSTNATYYPMFSTTTSGTLSNATISTTKMQFNPSSGQLTVQDLNTLSDATLKDNPTQIEDPFSILSQLLGMGFTWKDTGKKSYGLMAQMLEKVLPELVNENAQGMKTVNYIPIIAFLIEAVNKQQADIEALKAPKKRKR